MTTSAVYDLIPNEDGGQNTRYPLGDKPAPEVAPPVPTYLNTSGETLTSVDLDWGQLGEGHTKFILQRWRLNTDTAWTTLTEPGKDDRNYTDSADLLEGQHVGYRIAASDGTNQSAWAPEAWTYVLRTPVDPGDAIMFDDFSSYTVGDSVVGQSPPGASPGVQYKSQTGTTDGVYIGTGGRSSDNCLHFKFLAATDGGNDQTGDSVSSQCQQQVQLCSSSAEAHSSLWVEFYLMTPDAGVRVRASNDKFLSPHNDYFSVGGRAAYGRQGTFFQSQTSTNGNSFATLAFSHYNEAGGKLYDSGATFTGGGQAPYGYNQLGNTDSWYKNWAAAATVNPGGSTKVLVEPAQAGTWVRYRMHVDIGQGGALGLMEWWKDNTLIQRTPQLYREWLDGYPKIDGMYLMGWFNAGFAQETIWKMDDISVYATDPGWTF